MTDMEQPVVQNGAASETGSREDFFAQEAANESKTSHLNGVTHENKGAAAQLLLCAFTLALFVFAVIAAFKFRVADIIIAGSNLSVTGEQILAGAIPADECVRTITATLLICVVCATVGASLSFIGLFNAASGKKNGAFMQLLNCLFSVVGLVCALMVHTNSEYKWGYAGNLGLTMLIVFAITALLSLIMMFISSEKKIRLTDFGKKITAIVSVVIVVALVLGISIPISVTRSSATNAGNVNRISYGDDYYTIEDILGTPYECDDTSSVLIWYDKDVMSRYEELVNARISATANIETWSEEAEKAEDPSELLAKIAEEKEKLAKTEADIAALPESAAARTSIAMEDGRAVAIALDKDIQSEEEKSTSSTEILRIYITDASAKTCVVLYKTECTDGSTYLIETEGIYDRSGNIYNVTFTNVLGKSVTMMKLSAAF